MYEKQIVINNSTGLHARPAAMLVSLANKHKAKITIRHNDKLVNARSMLNVLGAGIRKGALIVIVGEGEDEQEAVEALCNLIEQFQE